jgi:hypothetical protein
VKKSLLLFSLLALIFILGLSFHAFSSDTYEQAGESRHVFRLPFKEDALYLRILVPLAGREVVFEREPDFGDHKIVRGALPFARDEKDYLCFAWDFTEQMLYLDLNRNLDLTDDPAGVVTNKGKSKWRPDFGNIRIQSDHPQGKIPYMVRVNLLTFNRFRQVFCNVLVRSGWQGDIELYGKKWQVAVVDNLDGVIGKEDIFTVRPYERSDKDPVEFGSTDRLYVPREFFLDGHAYDLAFDFASQKKKSELIASFMESRPAMGEVQLDGRFIKRLILRESKEKGSPLVILDSPDKIVRLPARTYRTQRIFLDGGKKHGLFWADGEKEISVVQGKIFVLKMGGHLNHSVRERRNGRNLSLDYTLLGIGDEKYKQLAADRRNPPTFAITRGDHTVFSGSFKYG